MNSEDQEHSEDDGSECEEEEDDEAIGTDLVGLAIQEEHRAGIIALLNQMFRDNSINPSGIADLVIEKKLGTATILDESEGDDDDADQGVFAVTAEINFSRHQNAACLKDLKTFLMKKIQENGTKEDIEFVEKELETSVFIMNEKMVNLPPQFTLVPLQCLEDEVAKSNSGGNGQEMIICILKVYKKANEESLCYIHPEEKVICDLSTRHVDYPVNTDEFGYIFVQSESGDEEECEDCPPFRRICFMPAHAFYTTCLATLKTTIMSMQTPPPV